jgi:hypothetical protein
MDEARAPGASPPASGTFGSGAADGLAVATLVVSCLYSCAAAFREIRYLVSQVADDASYYLEIAENAALGHGFTFDRINPTNGFHPLWTWILVAVRRVLPLDPEGMFRFVWILQSLILTVAGWILWRLLRRVAGSWPAALGTVLFVGRLYYTGRAGMEAAVVLLLTIVLVDRLDRRPATGDAGAPGPAQTAALGLLLGGLMLARLDSLFVCGALLGGWVLGNGDVARARARLGPALLAGGLAALLLLPYLAWNLSRFGHLTPISGSLKMSFPHPGWYVSSLDVHGQAGAVLVLATVLGAWLVVERVFARRASRPAFADYPLAAFAAGVLAHELFSVLFMKWGVFEWHFVQLRLLLALALPVLLARALLPRGTAARAAWAIVTGLAALASLALIVKRDGRLDYSRSWTVQAYEAARWADRHLPADAVLAMKDAGGFGYFSRRRVVNVDGLVNGYEYQDSLRVGAFEGFLRRKGVEFYVQHAIPNRPDITSGRYDSLRFESYSHLYDRPGGSLLLERSDEVYRSKPFIVGADSCVFLIWRMPSR